MQLRLGKILAAQRILTTTQIDEVLAEQKKTGEPFGLLCERMFQIDPALVERAWAEQYSRVAARVNPLHEQIDLRAQSMITRRQAWQFGVLPLRFDGVELMIATTPGHLRRALRFATAVIGTPVYLVMCAPDELGEALCRYYPLPGMSPRSVMERDAKIGSGAST